MLCFSCGQSIIVKLAGGPLADDVLQMQPDHLPQNLRWMFLTTDATTFDCTSCPALTTVIVHSEQYVQDLPVTWKNISGLTEVHGFQSLINE